MLPVELRSMVKTFPAGPPFVCLWDMNVGLHRVVGNINAENFSVIFFVRKEVVVVPFGEERT